MNIRNWLALVCLLSLAMAPIAAAEESSAKGGGSVVGTVVDSDQKGVEGVDVSIYAADDTKTAIATAETSADGKFTVKEVAPATGYLVKAVKRKSLLGVRAEQADVAVEAGKATDLGKLELKVPAKK